MTIRSIVELLAQADATLANNTTQDISPADVRDLIKDFLDTMSPAYGAINLVSQVLALTAVPIVIAPYAAQDAATANYYSTNIGAGSVTRASAGVAGITDFIIGSGSVQGANNANVTVELFKNGVATGFKASVTCSGAGESVGFNIVAIQYTAAATATYTLRASGPANNYTFINTVLLVQAQPVRTFV